MLRIRLPLEGQTLVNFKLSLNSITSTLLPLPRILNHSEIQHSDFFPLFIFQNNYRKRYLQDYLLHKVLWEEQERTSHKYISYMQLKYEGLNISERNCRLF